MKKVIYLTTVIVCFFSIMLSGQEKSDEKAETEKTDFIQQADQQRYDNCILLVKLNQKDKAFQSFSDYIEFYPKGKYRLEAYKYMAEIYKERFKYMDAIKIYMKIYGEFSQTDDGIEAYYNAGLAYSRMGIDKKAIQIYNDIISEYPASAYADQSKDQLDMMEMLKK